MLSLSLTFSRYRELGKLFFINRLFGAEMAIVGVKPEVVVVRQGLKPEGRPPYLTWKRVSFIFYLDQKARESARRAMLVAKAQRSKDFASTARSAPGQAKPVVQVCVPIKSNVDILEARQKGRKLAGELGFSSTDCTLIATAISELARNIVTYAKQGEVRLSPAMRIHAAGTSLSGVGIAITARDKGPGIRDVSRAMLDGFSTARGLGLGLPGVKRIMDEFEIDSKPHAGTTVTVKKWRVS